MLRRVGIYVFDVKWDLLKDAFPELLRPNCSNVAHIMSFTPCSKPISTVSAKGNKETALTIIRELSVGDVNEADEVLKRLQLRWLSALRYRPMRLRRSGSRHSRQLAIGRFLSTPTSSHTEGCPGDTVRAHTSRANSRLRDRRLLGREANDFPFRAEDRLHAPFP
jgi:hypothetical protein